MEDSFLVNIPQSGYANAKYTLNVPNPSAGYIVKAYVLLIAICPLHGDIKPGGPLGAN